MLTYTGDILRAVELMEQGLKAPITLDGIAAHTGYSPWHFHRLFSAVSGETPADYLRKRRLTEAARELRGTRRRVTDLALEYQFGSPEAFTRAFARVFGVTPSEYRRRGTFVRGSQKAKTTEATIRHIKEGLSVQPRFEELGAMALVGMICYQGGVDGVGRLWQGFGPRIPAVPNQTEPDAGYEIHFRTEPGTCFMPAVRVSDLSNVPMDMVGKTLPAARYAVFTHRGPVGRLGMTYEYIYGKWLPESPYVLAGDYDFERYDSRFGDGRSEDSQHDIYVPVRPSS